LKFSNNFSFHKENLFVKEEKKREYILEHSEFLFIFGMDS